MAQIKHAGVWIELITDADYYTVTSGLVADEIERDRAARDARYAFNGLRRSPYSDYLLLLTGDKARGALHDERRTYERLAEQGTIYVADNRTPHDPIVDADDERLDSLTYEERLNLTRTNR